MRISVSRSLEFFWFLVSLVRFFYFKRKLYCKNYLPSQQRFSTISSPFSLKSSSHWGPNPLKRIAQHLLQAMKMKYTKNMFIFATVWKNSSSGSSKVVLYKQFGNLKKTLLKSITSKTKNSVAFISTSFFSVLCILVLAYSLIAECYLNNIFFTSDHFTYAMIAITA